ncbi:MAG TPA: hypothetical protein VFN32_03790 [Rhodococcus sp. (in: high G+C Gram-positive bacteria)]|uniref:hypothetical protein n=1 Tax=Rhodococcus sp. SJ-3 TaxID=3454628 RepID=UPI002DAC910C|nr:hypothetical protein [Rhodococcus sp. (in: high G+C Gram-positive bacteria)]
MTFALDIVGVAGGLTRLSDFAAPIAASVVPTAAQATGADVTNIVDDVQTYLIADTPSQAITQQVLGPVLGPLANTVIRETP